PPPPKPLAISEDVSHTKTRIPATMEQGAVSTPGAQEWNTPHIDLAKPQAPPPTPTAIPPSLLLLSLLGLHESGQIAELEDLGL
ncbi:hypothetical protein KUCAC02_007640, partial [Chaenocephalus aceratus]